MSVKGQTGRLIYRHGERLISLSQLVIRSMLQLQKTREIDSWMNTNVILRSEEIL